MTGAGDPPLSGLRVLELCQVMAGPFCCQVLGDMGADVVKVEPPGTGDQSRRSMGFKMKGEDTAAFLAVNRNKRSVTLDLKDDAHRRAFYRLVETADVPDAEHRPGEPAKAGAERHVEALEHDPVSYTHLTLPTTPYV